MEHSGPRPYQFEPRRVRQNEQQEASSDHNCIWQQLGPSRKHRLALNHFAIKLHFEQKTINWSRRVVRLARKEKLTKFCCCLFPTFLGCTKRCLLANANCSRMRFLRWNRTSPAKSRRSEARNSNEMYYQASRISVNLSLCLVAWNCLILISHSDSSTAQIITQETSVYFDLTIAVQLSDWLLP